jgi:two-component system response regulator AlgR
MRLLIVDDEKPARDRLQRLLSDIANIEIVGQAANGTEAIDAVVKHDVELVLMDIRMPGMDGLEAASHLSNLDEPPAVIFTTAFADHALEAFQTHAVDYLLKPVKRESLISAIEAAQKPTRAQSARNNTVFKNLEERAHICARVRGNLVLVAIDDIYYFQADQKYVLVRYSGGEVLIEDSLKTLEDEFGDRFYRIHRNALISIRRVTGLRNDNGVRVTFRDIDDTLEISRRHLPGVRKIIKNL